MKHPFLVTCVVLFVGIALASAWAKNHVSGSTSAPVIATKMTYRTLANGAVVYEEVAGQPEAPQDIAPAAGDNDQGAAPTFHYDPLTQTYRRTTNGQNDTIRDANNPSAD